MTTKTILPSLLLLTVVSLSSCMKDDNIANQPRPADTDTFKDDLTPQPNPYRLIAHPNERTSASGGYYAALPPEYDSTTKRYPLLLAIHGSGEYGRGNETDPDNVLGNSVAMRVSNKSLPISFTSNNEQYSFVIIIPQFYFKPEPHHLKEVFDTIINNYRIDTNRIYLTGLSVGGGATWEFAGSMYGNMLAAVVPICGATDFSAIPALVDQFIENDVPAWAFHNDNDQFVSAGITRKITSTVNLKDPKHPIRMTIWADGYHDAWTKASSPYYREEGKNIYEWMLQYVRN